MNRFIILLVVAVAAVLVAFWVLPPFGTLRVQD
jgi:hypothetical protein